MIGIKRVPLYERLPEIYRTRDAEQLPPGQLAAYLGAVEQVFGALHESIEALYADLFIDTCDDWVIPYIGDLLGTSHLKGDKRTLRADVADTIALRRRKGTLGAVERLAANLTGWPCRAVELFPNLAWAQHLNHQRPDRGGVPPYGMPEVTRFTPRRGGTVPIRDPAMLSLIGTAFDPFAYTADAKRADDGAKHINLPNLAIHLWRLPAYRLGVMRPLLKGVENLGPPPAGSNRARWALRFDLDPLDRPVRLFNIWERPETDPATGIERLTAPDSVAAPILPARLDGTSAAGNPWVYVSVDSFTEGAAGPEDLDLGDVGLQLYIPQSILDGVEWRIRSGNLCAWETGLRFDLEIHDIVIDPVIGRVLVGLASAAERDAMVANATTDPRPRVYFGYTYGAVGPVGAHPVSREFAPVEGAELRIVNALDPAAPSLQDALANLQDETGPLVVEIRDSLVHDLDPASLPGAIDEGGVLTLRLAHPLVLRAAGLARPVIRLAAPLAFRPVDPAAPEAIFVSVELHGLFITAAADFAPPDGPLIARAALARLELTGCTLDPGGHQQRDGSRAGFRQAMRLANGYGFVDGAEEDAFEPTPDIVVNRSVTGSLAVDDGYTLHLQDSIVDAGDGPDDAPGPVPAIGPATVSHGAAISIRNITVLGTTLVREARGSGAIFVHRLDVWNHQKGCLKFCYFSGDGDRLPPNYACVSGGTENLVFTSIRHGQPGYCQLARGTGFAVTNRGPEDDQMGAFGSLLEAHRLANLNIRLREFNPVGIRPLVLLMT
ncbi:MAG: phage tail protein [Alphaproteobacteria bacterium]